MCLCRQNEKLRANKDARRAYVGEQSDWDSRGALMNDYDGMNDHLLTTNSLHIMLKNYYDAPLVPTSGRNSKSIYAYTWKSVLRLL